MKRRICSGLAAAFCAAMLVWPQVAAWQVTPLMDAPPTIRPTAAPQKEGV